MALAWATVAVARRRAAALASAGVAASGARRAGRGGRGMNLGIWLIVAGHRRARDRGAGPSVTVPVSHANGTVILAVDVSGSMSATDVSPTRLSAAKTAAQTFINAQPGNVEIGVIAFEDGGLEASVPSTDHATALAAVRRSAPEAAPRSDWPFSPRFPRSPTGRSRSTRAATRRTSATGRRPRS